MVRPVLKLKELSLRYPHSDRWILDGINLILQPGETLALVGASGCGKSTVARAVMQLLPPGTLCEGEILVDGIDPRKLSRQSLRTLRGNTAGMVFQDPMTRLNPLMTVGGHLIDTLIAHRPKQERKELRELAKNLLERLGINKRRFNSYPHELSGGMRQRLAIAMAISLKPPLLIADEPTTSLDVSVAEQVMKEISNLCKELGTTLMLISHDLAMTSRWCERVAILEGGRKVEEGPIQILLTQPQSKLGKQLLASAKAREGEYPPKAPGKKIVLQVEEIRCWHRNGSIPWASTWIKAVDGITFNLKERETIGIVGPSGCGKSTLCKALIGIHPMRGGKVQLFGKNLLTLKGSHLRKARRSIQMVFQDPLASLNPCLKVCDAIADPLLIHRICSKNIAIENSRELLKLVNLNPDYLQQRLPKDLSGGQLQRVAIARALALEPKVLICDESISMLDAEVQNGILSLLHKLQGKLGLAIIFVTHDLSIANSFCHRIIVLDQGRIAEEGAGEKIFQNPKSSISRKLIDASPRLPKQSQGREGSNK